MVGGEASDETLFQMLEILKGKDVAPNLDQVESRIGELMKINTLLGNNRPISDELSMQMWHSKLTKPLKKAVRELLRYPLSEWGFSESEKGHFDLSQTITWTPQYIGGVIAYVREGELSVNRILNEKIAALPNSSLKSQLIDGFENMIDLASASFDAEEGKLAILAQKFTESIAALKAKTKLKMANATDEYSKERIWDLFQNRVSNRYPAPVSIHYSFGISVMFGRFGLPELDTSTTLWTNDFSEPKVPQELLQLE